MERRYTNFCPAWRTRSGPKSSWRAQWGLRTLSSLLNGVMLPSCSPAISLDSLADMGRERSATTRGHTQVGRRTPLWTLATSRGLPVAVHLALGALVGPGPGVTKSFVTTAARLVTWSASATSSTANPRGAAGRSWRWKLAGRWWRLTQKTESWVPAFV